MVWQESIVSCHWPLICSLLLRVTLRSRLLGSVPYLMLNPDSECFPSHLSALRGLPGLRALGNTSTGKKTGFGVAGHGVGQVRMGGQIPHQPKLPSSKLRSMAPEVTEVLRVGPRSPGLGWRSALTSIR